jgi:hypothetical protein
LNLDPGQSVTLHARLFDANGRFVREETGATWALKGLEGTVANGVVTIANKPVQQAGVITATVGKSERRSSRACGASAAVDRRLR